LVGEASEKIYIYDRMHDREGAFVLLSAYIEERRDEHVALFEAYLANGALD
jgi:hypothetical protein